MTVEQGQITEELFQFHKSYICLAMRNWLVAMAAKASNRGVLFQDQVFQTCLDTLDPDNPDFDKINLFYAIRAFSKADGMMSF